MKTSDVLVIGAGPTGLVSALTLAANGVPVHVTERDSAPSQTSRALGIQARSMELLAGLGVADAVDRVAYRLSGAAIMRGNRELVNLPWIPPPSPYPHTHVLPQAGLEQILTTRLQELGIEIERDAELEALWQDSSGVTARLADGRSIEADWLIGADGGRSVVREALGIAFPGHATGETYYLADAVLRFRAELGDSAMWLGSDGPLMLMRLPAAENLWRVFVDVTDTARHAQLPELTAPVLAKLLSDRGPNGTRIDSIEWTSVFHSRLCLADSYRRNRAFIVGDAAHVFPPFGGQGMNLGIQDAVNIGWRLAAVHRGAPERLLDDYEAERRPVAAATIREVETRRRAFALRNPVARTLRDLTLRLVGGSHRAARRTSLQNAQLDIGYHKHSRGGRLAEAVAGARAPDGPFAGGSVQRLFGPDHVTLLEFGDAADGPTLVRDGRLHTAFVHRSTDPDGTLRRLYGFPRGEGYVVVRPDGHIAARSTNRDGAVADVAEMLPDGEKKH